MADLYGFDAFSPGEVAHRIDAIGVVKARLPLRAMGLLAKFLCGRVRIQCT